MHDLAALSNLLDERHLGERESDACTAVSSDKPTPGSIGPGGVYKTINVAAAKGSRHGSLRPQFAGLKSARQLGPFCEED